MTNYISLCNLDSHPLAARFYDLAVELEKLPASPEQTTLAIALDKLRREAERLLNETSTQPQNCPSTPPSEAVFLLEKHR